MHPALVMPVRCSMASLHTRNVARIYSCHPGRFYKLCMVLSDAVMISAPALKRLYTDVDRYQPPVLIMH